MSISLKDKRKITDNSRDKDGLINMKAFYRNMFKFTFEKLHIPKKYQSKIKRDTLAIIQNPALTNFPIFTTIDIIFTVVSLLDPKVAVAKFLIEKLLLEFGIRFVFSLIEHMTEIRTTIRIFNRQYPNPTPKQITELTKHITSVILGYKVILPYQLVSIEEYIVQLIDMVKKQK